MLVELATEIMDKAEISNDVLFTFVQMIAKPSLYVFRGIAILGMIYPILSITGLNRKTPNVLGKISLVFFWIGLNAFVISSNIDIYWKWVWIDMLGLLSSFAIAVRFNNSYIRRYYRNLYRKKIAQINNQKAS